MRLKRRKLPQRRFGLDQLGDAQSDEQLEPDRNNGEIKSTSNSLPERSVFEQIDVIFESNKCARLIDAGGGVKKLRMKVEMMG